MPLNEVARFKAKLSMKNQFSVPRPLRWRYKMEAGEVLQVSVRVFDSDNYEEEEFFAKMSQDGRVTVPKLTMDVMRLREGKKDYRRRL